MKARLFGNIVNIIFTDGDRYVAYVINEGIQFEKLWVFRDLDNKEFTANFRKEVLNGKCEYIPVIHWKSFWKINFFIEETLDRYSPLPPLKSY